MKPTNCPNCGAPLKDGRCEYCGTITNDVDSEIARLELEKQSIMNQMENQRQITLQTLILNGYYKPFPP
jgi:uncharacterized Zn finger protein (UPF0148 family)